MTNRLALPSLVVALLAAMLAGLSLGPISIGPERVVRAVLGLHSDVLATIAVRYDRAPRVLIGSVAGAMLATSGLFMQIVTFNPLAAPELTGVSAGAALAAVVATTFAPGLALSSLLPVIAIGGGLLTGAAVYLVAAQHRRQRSPTRLVLTGVVTASVLSSGMSLVLVGTGVDPTLVLRWLVGSLDLRTWQEWNLLWPIALLLLPLVAVAPSIANLAQLGDDVTTSLGLRASFARFYLLGLAVSLAAAAVSVVGPIAFVGLIAPQLSRTAVGGDVRRLLPATALVGATLVLAADLVARTLTLKDIPLLSHLVHQGSAVGNAPVGVYLALIGAPVFFFLVLRSERR